ncbi:hypothetical protein [Candidatus Tisiphia endosymbiont of Nemotelus uliginosus]|uniref:hypothetical protein n=1 Tax=Candidatus Tisiphia endosymbiont of Nemotelus uliginosus TaxID=3077926 RepID=UPI0035C90D50
MAYAIAIKTGEIEEQEQPVKMKKTLGCRAYSVLQLGIKLIKQEYSRSHSTPHLLLKLKGMHNVFS